MPRILARGIEVPVKRAALAALLVSLASCRPSGDPVRASLDAVASAAHARDAGELMDNVAADFQAADGSRRADAESTLKTYFAAYEILDVTLSDVTIERSESGPALARFTARLSGQPRKIGGFGGLAGLVPSSSTWKFEARLVPDGRRWKIAWASWSPVSGPQG
jgi:hypothetical protein